MLGRRWEMLRWSNDNRVVTTEGDRVEGVVG